MMCSALFTNLTVQLLTYRKFLISLLNYQCFRQYYAAIFNVICKNAVTNLM